MPRRDGGAGPGECQPVPESQGREKSCHSGEGWITGQARLLFRIRR